MSKSWNQHCENRYLLWLF